MRKPPSPEAHETPARWRPAVEVALILAVFLVAGGSPPPDVNEPHWLARLKHFWDPDWCHGDLFLRSPDAHFTIVLLAGWLTKWLPLAAVAWIGRLSAWTLIAWAWQRLSWRVAPTPLLAVLTAALWTTGLQQLHLAGEWVIGGVEAKCFAYALLLLALRNYLDGRWNRVWLQLGLASAMHALVGGWSVLVLLALWAIYHRQECSFRQMLPGLIGGGLLAMLGVAPALAMNWGADPAVVREANQIYVFYRLPHHLALLTMPPGWLADRAGRHLLMLGLLAICSWVAVRWRKNDSSDSNSVDSTPDLPAVLRLLRFAWGAATLMLLGLLIEWALAGSPDRGAGLMRYYWYRLTDSAAPLAAALAVGAFLAAGVRRETRWAAALLMVLLVACVWHLNLRLQADGKRAIPPTDRRMRDFDDWQDVCGWASESTPHDAVFLVPRHSQSFKWRAGRAEVVTWKDIPQNAADLVEWRRRLEDVYRHPNSGEFAWNVHSLSELGASRLQELGRCYNARFVLTTHYRPVSLPVVYLNKSYVVYELKSGSRDGMQ